MTFDAYRTDPAKFIDDFLPLNEKGEPWRLSPHQRKVLQLAMRFSAEGRLVGLRYLIWGELKKSGKTLLAVALVAWWAYTRPHTEVIVVANDEKQAVGRVFRTLVGADRRTMPRSRRQPRCARRGSCSRTARASTPSRSTTRAKRAAASRWSPMTNRGAS